MSRSSVHRNSRAEKMTITSQFQGPRGGKRLLEDQSACPLPHRFDGENSLLSSFVPSNGRHYKDRDFGNAQASPLIMAAAQRKTWQDRATCELGCFSHGVLFARPRTSEISLSHFAHTLSAARSRTSITWALKAC